MAKSKSVLRTLPPPKVSKSISLDGAVWDSVETLKERIRTLEVPVAFEANDIIEEALRDAVTAANHELDRMTKSA